MRTHNILTLLKSIAGVAVGNGLSIAPSVHFAWTNLDGKPAAEEYIIYGGLTLGTNL